MALADTLAAANGADFDTSEPAVIADTLSLIALTTGLSATLLSTFSSISAITGSNAVLLGNGFSNVPEAGAGSSYSMSYFESANPLSVSFNGNTYTFEAPLNYLNATAILV
ncbi:MAG: hypothetical protein ACYCPN_05605 [Thermoplasmata archaeon]